MHLGEFESLRVGQKSALKSEERAQGLVRCVCLSDKRQSGHLPVFCFGV